MARITSVIAKNRRKNSDSFIEFLSASLQIQADNTETLKEMSVGINKIVDNTKSMELIGSVLKALTSSMGSLVNVLIKNVEQQKTSAFFSGALAKEKEYESKFGKKDLSKAPTKVTGATETDKGSFLSSLLKWLGGLLVVGGGLSWLWQNEEFKTKVINFFGTMIDSIIEGASEIYTFAKNWINDEKNQETIGNFVSGLLNAISKGFELMGDLWKAVVKEYEKEDSPLKKTVNGILESLWGFVGEHPLIALGGALYTFSGLLPALVGALMLANTTIGKAIGPLGLLIAAYEGGKWIGEKIRTNTNDSSNSVKEHLMEEAHKKLKKIKDIKDPELKKELETKIAQKEKEFNETSILGFKYTPEEAKRYAIEFIYSENEQRIQNDVGEQAERISQRGMQPNLAPIWTPLGSDLVGETPQPSVSTTPSTEPTKLNIIDEYKKGVSKIEGARYNQMGGKENAYAGKYQMGRIEIAEAAKSLGEEQPTREQFLNDPNMQERYFEAYTKSNYNYLTKMSPEYNKLSKNEQLKVLAYAHNAGVGNTTQHLKEGNLKFSESKAFYDEVGKNLSQKEDNILSPTKLKWAPGVNQNIDENTKQKLLELQKIYGDKMVITSGGEKTGHVSNSQHYQGKAVDIRLNGTPEERANFIRDASAMGFTGIGAYKSGLIHIDTRPKKMTWGDTYRKGSEPEWAKLALQEHMFGDIDTLKTPGKVSREIPKSESPFKFNLSDTDKRISTEGSESPMSWFEDIIFNAMSNQSFSPKNTLEKIRAMPRGLINAPPKFSGGLLGNQSLSLLNNLQKPPEININAPNINNGRKQESSKPPENTLVSIFDKEFIEMLMERNVSPNPFLFT